MRAQAVALPGVQGPLEQRAEDRGLDVAPVRGRGLEQEPELLAGERQGRRRSEEPPVELQERPSQQG